MGYKFAMECAGAKVHLFEQFGSYQGDWWALVTYKRKKGWVQGTYGSCSGCDAFEGEFGYDSSHFHNDGKHISCYGFENLDKNCEKCKTLKIKLVDFGKEYLDNILSQKQAEEVAERNVSWDTDAIVMLKFIKDNAIKRGE